MGLDLSKMSIQELDQLLEQLQTQQKKVREERKDRTILENKIKKLEHWFETHGFQDGLYNEHGSDYEDDYEEQSYIDRYTKVKRDMEE